MGVHVRLFFLLDVDAIDDDELRRFAHAAEGVDSNPGASVVFIDGDDHVMAGLFLHPLGMRQRFLFVFAR